MLIQMITGFVNSGEKSGDRVLRNTMLIDHLFQNLTHKPEMHKHTIDRDIRYDYVMLLQGLAKLENDWCKDRIIHLGIFECILKETRGCRYGHYITL
jgi:hypothetical protein